nr:MAG TPA_asm: hypothetical protein [Caudoviricetes sp.]
MKKCSIRAFFIVNNTNICYNINRVFNLTFFIALIP